MEDFYLLDMMDRGLDLGFQFPQFWQQTNFLSASIVKRCSDKYAY